MHASEFLPPALADFGLRVTRSVVGFTGTYPTWSEVEQQCDGYEAARVIEAYVREASTLPYVGNAENRISKTMFSYLIKS